MPVRTLSKLVRQKPSAYGRMSDSRNSRNSRSSRSSHTAHSKLAPNCDTTADSQKANADLPPVASLNTVEAVRPFRCAAGERIEAPAREEPEVGINVQEDLRKMIERSNERADRMGHQFHAPQPGREPQVAFPDVSAAASALRTASALLAVAKKASKKEQHQEHNQEHQEHQEQHRPLQTDSGTVNTDALSRARAHRGHRKVQLMDYAEC